MFAPSAAEAGRKRVVVLELDGPKAAKFQKDLIKLIKKSHTVVPLSKWNRTADDLGASKPTPSNIRKVAKKLKIDAVIEGKIDKRRDDYILKLKLRSGATGELIGNGVETKAEGPRIDASAQRDLKDELIPVIGDMKANRGGGGDDEEEEEEEEDKPAKKKPMKVEEEEDEEEEEEEAPRKKGFSRKSDDDENPLPKATKAAKKVEKDEEEEEDDEGEDEDDEKPRKKVASRDEDDEDSDEDDEEGIEEEGEVAGLEGAEALAPGERAVDFAAGVTVNARRMSFTFESNLGNKPPPYKGVPVAGALIDATVYPLAIGHKRRGMAKNFGLTVMYDKVLKIQSEAGDVTYPTAQARWAVGAAFRYPLGKLTVGAMLRYGRQNFTIGSVMSMRPDIPNVNYTLIDPMITFRYQAGPKIVLNVNAGFMLVTNTGQIQNMDQYGPATVTGFEGELGGDYMLTKNLFARAAFRFETIGFKFNGGAALSNGRDSDMEQDVFGARDTYLGGAVTVGYLY